MDTNYTCETMLNDAIEYARESNNLFEQLRTTSDTAILTKAWYYRGQAVGMYQALIHFKFSHDDMQCLTDLLTLT